MILNYLQLSHSNELLTKRRYSRNMTDFDFSTLTGVSPVITNDRMSKALTDWFKQNVKFTHWEFVGETGKGVAYFSELIRIKIFGIDGENIEKHVQVILKTMPRNICRRLSYRSTEFSKNEIVFYTEVLPALLKFESTKKLALPFKKCVKLFFSYCDGQNDVICLEDASLENYVGAVGQVGIDVDHCRMIFKSLAEFHALSFAMKDQDPKEFDKIGKTVVETYFHAGLWDWYKNLCKRLCGIAIDSVEKEYPNTVYVKKIKEFAVPEEMFQKMITATTKTYDIGVISHGDCWTNNFLFKYENNKPIDAKIIDFQVTRCATPVLDISFVICACTTQDMRLSYYDELLAYYHEMLSARIREMGSNPDKVYSKDQFMEQIKKYFCFGLAFSFESTPYIVLTPEESEKMDLDRFSGKEKRDIDEFTPFQPFKTKEERLREANNVVFCVDRGYI